MTHTLARDDTAPATPDQAGSTSETAIASMTTAMIPSRTRHARGLASTRPSSLAPYASEKNHTTLFKASLEWLEKGSVNGSSSGVVRLGY